MGRHRVLEATGGMGINSRHGNQQQAWEATGCMKRLREEWVHEK
jgi:hypothetical protein